MKRIVFTPGICLLFVILMCSPQLFSQNSFILSKNADFSSDDRVFTRNDTFFMRVTAPVIDFTDIDKNEFRLKPNESEGGEESGNDFEGTFTNFLNGSYEASLSLNSADPLVSGWEWRARIRDNSGNEFEVEVAVQIIDGEPEVLTIRGTIDSLGSDFLVVNSTTILVDTQTSFLNQGNDAISFGDLKLNDLVKVDAIHNPNGDLLALKIMVESSSAKEVEVMGEIEALGADNLVVLAKTFFVDQNTEILDNNENPIAFSQLAVGQVVKITADEQPDGTLLATRIKIEEDVVEEVQFTGVIDAITDTSVVVDSVFFRLTESTVFLDSDGNPINLSDLSVGLRVQIRGERGSDGALRATQIKIEESNQEIDVTGQVTDIGGNFIEVANLRFEVDEQTVVLDNNDNPISLSSIIVGFVVQVRADVQADSSLLAKQIKVEQFFNEQVEITGPIESIQDSTVVVSGFEFVVTDSTVISDKNESPIELTDLRVGAIVEVRAEMQLDGTHIATRIELTDPFQDEVELTGTIDEIGLDSLLVSGIPFFVDANTEILDNQENEIVLTNLSVGLLLEIRANLRSDGKLLATRIKIENRIEDEIKVTGVIEQLSSTSITILSRTFGITANSVVFDENNSMINLSGLFVGQTVEVRGDLLPDGTLVVIRIKIEDQQANEIEVVGPVESFGPGTVEVIGINFFVDAATEIFDESNLPIEFSALEIGQTVEVRALGQPNGTRLATRIRIQDVLLLSGTVEQIDINGISMVGLQVLFDSNTLILGKLNKFLTIGELQVGQFVEVRAIMGSGNTIFGTKVRVQGLVTSVSPRTPEERPPEDFVLLKNYPNPFNPTTTIIFRIPGNSVGAPMPGKLTIFNLLGQAVRTLINEPLSAGVTHLRQWDGKDDDGKNLSTGIYLYRLKVGRFTQTERMALIK